jgi:hypothetical protein
MCRLVCKTAVMLLLLIFMCKIRNYFDTTHDTQLYTLFAGVVFQERNTISFEYINNSQFQ